MDRTTLTANLKPLERRGLVKVSIDDADKRTRRLKLTPAGRAILVSAAPIWKQTHAIVETLLPRANCEELRVDLRVLSQSTRRAGPAAFRYPVRSVPMVCFGSSTWIRQD